MAERRRGMGQDDQFNDEGKQAIESRQKQEVDDFNNSMADRETGQQRWFGFERNASQNKAREKRQKRALEHAVLISAAYAKLYQETSQKLGDAENAVYDALVEGAEKVSDAQNLLNQTIDNASTTDDGIAVFKADDGSVYTQDGQLLEDDELDNITWRENASSWEEYQKQLNDLREKQEFLERMNLHEQHLAEIRVEMEDEINPPSEERLLEMNEEIKIIYDDVRKDNNVKSEFTVQEIAPTALPDLGL